jgi:hypothetical protein
MLFPAFPQYYNFTKTVDANQSRDTFFVTKPETVLKMGGQERLSAPVRHTSSIVAHNISKKGESSHPGYFSHTCKPNEPLLTITIKQTVTSIIATSKHPELLLHSKSDWISPAQGLSAQGLSATTIFVEDVLRSSHIDITAHTR